VIRRKFHDNESTHILHNFWTSTHRGKLSPLPPSGGATAVQQLSTDINSYNVDIAAVTETHPKNKHTDSVVAIQGYTLLRSDRLRHKGGGVIIIIIIIAMTMFMVLSS